MQAECAMNARTLTGQIRKWPDSDEPMNLWFDPARACWLKARKPGLNCANLPNGSVAARDRRIKQMSRRCHQEGHVRLRDDVKRSYSQGLYRVRSEAQPGGKWKSENLGYKDEITKQQAQRRLQTIISRMELEIVGLSRPVMTVNADVEDHYIPEFVSKREPSTRMAYL
jgi:hypothetical protein